jgi:hypothetical protein
LRTFGMKSVTPKKSECVVVRGMGGGGVIGWSSSKFAMKSKKI